MNQLSKRMIWVYLALLPGIIIYGLLFGPQIWLRCLWAIISAIGFEALALRLRGRPLLPSLSDGSAGLTGLLLALCLPPDISFALLFLGVGSALLLGKHVYGGLGQNIFNPAMVGFAILLVSFPLAVSDWPGIDALSSATPLDYSRSQLLQGTVAADFYQQLLFGVLGAAQWEWISLAWLAGGLLLWAKGIIDPRLPLSFLAMLLLCAELHSLFDPTTARPLGVHIFAGATLFGAFFIITDPVTASTTRLGRWLFGAGVGLLTFIIRQYGGSAEGFAFAVLLMNITVPLLDKLTVSRYYGQS